MEITSKPYLSLLELVLATTIRHNSRDGRFSRENKAWAQNVQMQSCFGAEENDRSLDYVVESHPGLVDLLATQFRENRRKERRKYIQLREIVFRGRRMDNGEWVLGNLFIGDNNECEICHGTPKARIAYKVDPATVGQYTELRDENGAKIYEGDIVEFEDAVADCEGYHDNVFINRAVIKYGEYGWTICRDLSVVTMEDLVYKGEFDGKVVGNIYDNPELL